MHIDLSTESNQNKIGFFLDLIMGGVLVICTLKPAILKCLQDWINLKQQLKTFQKIPNLSKIQES